jgi:hypothetical protein
MEVDTSRLVTTAKMKNTCGIAEDALCDAAKL